MKAIKATIDKLYDQASDLAIEAIRNEAYWILKHHSDHLNEFVMAMGSAFFTDKNGNPIDENEFKLKVFKDFFDICHDLNNKFNCFGYPMRLKVDVIDGSLHELNDW
jgi:hypothetical protein